MCLDLHIASATFQQGVMIDAIFNACRDKDDAFLKLNACNSAEAAIWIKALMQC